MVQDAKKSSVWQFQKSLQIGVLILLGLVLVGVITRQLAPILQPLLIAMFICYLAVPFRNFFNQRLKLPAAVANLVMAFVLIIFLAGISWVITSNINLLLVKIPSYKEKINILYETFVNSAFSLPFLGEPIAKFLKEFELPIDTIFGYVKYGLSSLLSLLGTSITVLFLLIFVLLEIKTLPQRITKAYGQKRGQDIQTVIQKINFGILTYIRIKTITSFVVALVSTIILFLFGVDLWLFWGMITFFANFIPYVGSIFAVASPVVIYLIQSSSPWATLLMAVLLVGSQNFIGTFLEPRIAGKALNLSPLLVILSLAFWGWLWGIVGMILAVPILVTIKTALEYIPATKSFALLLGEGVSEST